ncbi:TPA: histidine kinase, partial [Enterococcus faecium]|nr:histidine kinase [Enterococcus faecium]
FILAIHQLLNRSFRNYIQQYQEIITSLNHSSTGDYKSINIENKVGDLKEIAMHINQFYLDNATYQKTLYENNWLKQEAKYAALQYQIEPHFLFNNLEFIRMTAILNDDEEISDSIYLLSKLYRNNTYQPDIIDLKEELINIDLSLQLHQRRYRHNFDYQLIDHIDQLMLPKLSLQPFVENYIKHGFDSSKKENRLTVYATETTNHYVLKIVENGKGMDQDKLEHIQQKLNDDIPYSENIGISNSFRRIKHLYPGDTRFVIESQLHVGTTITIKIQKGGNMHVENCNC